MEKYPANKAEKKSDKHYAGLIGFQDAEQEGYSDSLSWCIPMYLHFEIQI
jgi:hypothetical protein